MSRRAIIVSVAVAVFAIAAVLAFAMFVAPSPQSQAVVTFLGYTNIAWPDSPRRVKYATFAAFRLTNASPERVCYCAESLEIWTEQGWQTNIIRATPTNWPHFGSSFAPGECSVFYVPPPTNGKWRIRLGFQERSEGWQGYRDRVNDYLANRGRTVRRETFGGRTYQIVSPEVTQ